MTDQERERLLAIGRREGLDALIDATVAWKADQLAMQLFERGGFATLQINPHRQRVPRVYFIDPADAVPVHAVQIAGALLVRDDKGSAAPVVEDCAMRAGSPQARLVADCSSIALPATAAETRANRGRP